MQKTVRAAVASLGMSFSTDWAKCCDTVTRKPSQMTIFTA